MIADESGAVRSALIAFDQESDATAWKRFVTDLIAILPVESRL